MNQAMDGLKGVDAYAPACLDDSIFISDHRIHDFMIADVKFTLIYGQRE
jgi:hypothetical protein